MSLIGFVVSAMEDVVELRDGIATFDTYWHNAFNDLHMIVVKSSDTGGFLEQCCCEGLRNWRAVTLLLSIFELYNSQSWKFIHSCIHSCLHHRLVSHDRRFNTPAQGSSQSNRRSGSVVIATRRVK